MLEKRKILSDFLIFIRENGILQRVLFFWKNRKRKEKSIQNRTRFFVCGGESFDISLTARLITSRERGKYLCEYEYGF